MNFLFKYLIITTFLSLPLYADDEECEPKFSVATQLQTSNPSYTNNTDSFFDSHKNYKELTNAYYYSIKHYHRYKNTTLHFNAIKAIYEFVDQKPQDPYSLDLLETVAIFFPTWEADVNIPLYRKIAQIPNHPKTYKAHMTLYFYGEKNDKEFALWNFRIIADDKTHSCQQDAQEFLDSIGKDWDKN